MYSAADIANWFLAWAEDEADGQSDLTALKLQKLLYYAQGHYLGWKGEKLFSEQIKAWAHGPVVPQIWHKYRDRGANVLAAPSEAEFSWNEVDEETSDFLVAVWNSYGGFSASRLRNMTHDEQPWKEAFSRAGDDDALSLDALERQFSGTVLESD